MILETLFDEIARELSCQHALRYPYKVRGTGTLFSAPTKA